MHRECNYQPPVRVRVSAHGSASGPELHARVPDLLDYFEQLKIEWAIRLSEFLRN
jgi:hypothetical protein